MAFLNALTWMILGAAVLYGAINILFLVQMSPHEEAVGAGPVWAGRLLKSVGVAMVAGLWLTFG